MKSIRKYIPSLLIVISSILVAIKLADVIAGSLSSSSYVSNSLKPANRSVNLKEFSAQQDVRLMPDKRYMAGTQNLEQTHYRLRTDSNGFIVGEDDLNGKKANQAVDIIFFGGSTTECLYVDEDKRFPYLISKLLKNENGNSLRTLNGGVSGSHSMHSLIQWIAKGVPYKPKYVTLMENINDLSLLTKTGTYWDAPEARKLIQTNGIQTGGNPYEYLRDIKNIIAPNLWQLFTRIYGGSFIVVDDEWAEYRKRDGVNDLEIEKSFHSSIISFVHLIRAWGSEPILMTQFNRLNVSDRFVKDEYGKVKQTMAYNDFVSRYMRFNQIIRDVAKGENVLLIDLDRTIEPSAMYMYDAVHVNTIGSEKVAEVIAQSLLMAYPQYFRKN